MDLDDGAFSDASLLGLALHYAALGWTREQIVADVRANTFREVMLHELGHTLGLRHGGDDDSNCEPNYVSAMNYDNQFYIQRADGSRRLSSR